VIQYACHPELLETVINTSYVGEVKEGQRDGQVKGFFKYDGWFTGKLTPGPQYEGHQEYSAGHRRWLSSV
jgi:hypothetical protein